MTYTIVLATPRGIAVVGVVSGSIAVGTRVPWAKEGVGAVATQGYTNVALGPLILSLLERGYSCKRAIEEALKTDPEPEYRQILVASCRGDTGHHTGRYCPDVKYVRVGPNFVCGGNCLISEEVVEAMFEEMIRTSTLHPLTRVLRALEVGHEVGGDARGDRSAAIVYTEPGIKPIVIRVDNSSEPVAELRARVARISSLYLKLPLM